MDNKDKKMIIGYTIGVFDLFHKGHLNILKSAKGMCDKLIVGVTTDELCYKRKGYYPSMKFEDRLDIMRSIKYCDVVIPHNTISKFETWKKLKFDYLFVGDDWYNTRKWNKLEKELKDVGVKVIYFPHTSGVSSTTIKNNIKNKDTL